MKKVKSDSCVGCLKGKMSRLPMTGVVAYNIHDKMDMIVADVIGPINIKTFSKNKYLLAMMDVNTRKLFICLMQTKDEVPSIVIHLLTLKQNQTRKLLKRFHSDNGGAFINGKLESYFARQGTIQTSSTPYTPQHNSLIERMNRTELEMMKAMMYHATPENTRPSHGLLKAYLWSVA